VWFQRDARGVPDRQICAIRELRLFEPVSGRLDPCRGEVHAGDVRSTRLNQLEEQTSPPTAGLEHRHAGWIQRQERIPETLRDREEAWILSFRRALGHLGVEVSGDPRVGRACALLLRRLRRIALQIHGAVSVVPRSLGFHLSDAMRDQS
jgi:hypothetical protein